MAMMFLPAKPGTCAICATAHEPHLAHNQRSLFYQMRFQATHGRGPTWADACAHLTQAQRDRWKAAMDKAGAAWTEPAEGDPIAEPHSVSGEEAAR